MSEESRKIKTSDIFFSDLHKLLFCGDATVFKNSIHQSVLSYALNFNYEVTSTFTFLIF